MENNTSVCYVGIVTEVKAIEGADNIELAIVDGWQVVVAKNVEHKVGDFIVYCEIDSLLPIKEEFEFLRKSSYKKMGEVEGFRLKISIISSPEMGG